MKTAIFLIVYLFSSTIYADPISTYNPYETCVRHICVYQEVSANLAKMEEMYTQHFNDVKSNMSKKKCISKMA